MKNPYERIMAMLDETSDLYGKAGKQYEKNILCFYNYYRRYIALRSFGFITQRRPPHRDGRLTFILRAYGLFRPSHYLF